MKTQTIKELVQVIDTKVLRELLSDGCFCEDVLHHRNRSQFVPFLEEDGLIDRREVLQKINSGLRQFHIH